MRKDNTSLIAAANDYTSQAAPEKKQLVAQNNKEKGIG